MNSFTLKVNLGLIKDGPIRTVERLMIHELRALPSASEPTDCFLIKRWSSPLSRMSLPPETELPHLSAEHKRFGQDPTNKVDKCRYPVYLYFIIPAQVTWTRVSCLKEVKR